MRALAAHDRGAPVIILTNAMVIGRTRRRMLDALDPARVTMQVSLDSGTPDLHDRHRGPGAFDRARAGIALLGELGFRVRVAATIDETDAAEEAGFADHGLELSVNTLMQVASTPLPLVTVLARDPRHPRRPGARPQHRTRQLPLHLKPARPAGPR